MVLALLQRRWSLRGREGLGSSFSLPPSIRIDLGIFMEIECLFSTTLEVVLRRQSRRRHCPRKHRTLAQHSVHCGIVTHFWIECRSVRQVRISRDKLGFRAVCASDAGCVQWHFVERVWRVSKRFWTSLNNVRCYGSVSGVDRRSIWCYYVKHACELAVGGKSWV